jgi:hypothetical protein
MALAVLALNHKAIASEAVRLYYLRFDLLDGSRRCFEIAAKVG